MNTISKFVLFVAVAMSGVAAQAQVYGELGSMPLKVKGTTGAQNLEASPSVYALTVGYGVHKNVAVEGMFTFDSSYDAVKLNGATNGAKLKVDSSYGLFVKPRMMFGEQFEVFGRLGFMETKLATSGPGLASTGTDSGFAYSLGANFYFTKTAYLTANYISLYKKDNTTIDGVSVGVGVKF